MQNAMACRRFCGRVRSISQSAAKNEREKSTSQKKHGVAEREFGSALFSSRSSCHAGADSHSILSHGVES